MKFSKMFFVYAAVAVAMIVWMNVAPSALKPPATTDVPIPAPRLVPDFSLTNQHGQPVTRADLAGQVWIANFIFSSCPGPCLDITKRMRSIDQALADIDAVRLVSFSIDPKTDTPATLATYATRVEASPRWLFLTGDRAITANIATNGFRFELSTDPANFAHSENIAVVDKTGTVRGWFDSHAANLTEDVRALVKTL